jgi:hypothetical protein
MLKRHTIGLLAAGWLVVAPATAALAAGDGIQAGPALLFPSLALTETYDDNIRLASDGTKGDWLTSVTPALRLALPVQRFYLEAEGGLDFIRYKDFDSEDSTNWFVGAAVGAAFPGGLSFRVGDTHAERYLPTSQEYGPGEDSSLNTARATVAFAVRNALRLEATGTRADYRFDRSQDRERVESTVQADAYWKFRPKVSAIVEAGFTDYSYDNNSVQDGSAVQVALGLSWDLTAKSTGFAKAGYQWKSYEDENPAAGIEDDSYYTVSAGVRHELSSRTLVQLALTRSSQESDFPENPFFLRTALDASVSQRFTAKIYGRAGVLVAHDAYPNVASYDNPYDPRDIVQTDERSDTTLQGNVALGFDVTRWLALEAAYTGVHRSSNFDTFDYDANRVSLSAKAAF